MAGLSFEFERQGQRRFGMIGTRVVENRDGKAIIAAWRKNHIIIMPGIQAAVEHDRPFPIGIATERFDIESRTGRFAR